MDFSNKIEDGFNFLVNCFFFGPTHFKRDFLSKIEGKFCFWSELFQINFKGISYVKWNYPPEGIEKHIKGILCKLEGELNFLVNFFLFQMNFKGIFN